MKRLSLALLALISPAAWAATATLSWVLPTQNTDGSFIPASGNGALAESRVEYGPCTAGGGLASVENQVNVPAPGTTTTVNGFVGGETVCFRVRAANNLGVVSEPSNVVSKTFDAPKPRPPILSAVATTAWEIDLDRRGNVRLARRVGTVELGAPCQNIALDTQRGTVYPVDLQYVTLDRSPRSSWVVARCGLS